MPITPDNRLSSGYLSRRDFLGLSAVVMGNLFLGHTIRRTAQLFPSLEAKTPSEAYQSPIHLNLINPAASLKCWVPGVGVDGEGELSGLGWSAGVSPSFADSLKRKGYERYTFGPSTPTSAELQTVSLPVAAMLARPWGFEVVTFAETQQWQRLDILPLIAGGSRTEPPLLSLFTDSEMSAEVKSVQPVIIELPYDKLMDGSMTLTPAPVYNSEAIVGTKTSLSYLNRLEVRNNHLVYLPMTTMAMDARNRVTPDEVDVNRFRYPDNLPPIHVRTGRIAYSAGAFEFLDGRERQIEAGVNLALTAIIPMHRSGSRYPIWQVEVASISGLSPDLFHQKVFMDPRDVIPVTADTLWGESLGAYTTVGALDAGALIAKKVIWPRLSNPSE